MEADNTERVLQELMADYVKQRDDTFIAVVRQYDELFDEDLINGTHKSEDFVKSFGQLSRPTP